MKILIILILLSSCREYSCEDCVTFPPEEPIRSTPNELKTSCSIFIEDESKVRWIYPEVTHKLHPGTWWIYDSIRMDGSKQYDRTFDLKDYLKMEKFKIGDSFFVRYEVRYRFQPEDQLQLDTLIY